MYNSIQSSQEFIPEPIKLSPKDFPKIWKDYKSIIIQYAGWSFDRSIESIPELITSDFVEDDNHYEKFDNKNSAESPTPALYVTKSGRQIVLPTRLELDRRKDA